MLKCGLEIGWSNPSDGDKWHSWMEMATWIEVHGDGVDLWWWSSSRLGKEEREKQNRYKAKVYLIRAIFFGDQDIMESVITFRIDGHTIKRGALIEQLGYLVLQVLEYLHCILSLVHIQWEVINLWKMIVKMLTHLHMMVKHLWCSYIRKGIKGGEEGDEVLPLGTPPPPIRCTATPRAVTGWPRPRRRSWGWHHHNLSGGTATPRVVPT
jgi:hypothetical protein